MPRIVRIYEENGRYYSAASHKRVLNPANTNAVTYERVAVEEIPGILRDRAVRKAAAKEAAAVNKAAAKTTYRDQYARAIPGVYDRIPVYKPGTARAGQKIVGTNKDSMVSALNRAFAKTNHIPLSPANRALMSQIYADEMAAAVAVQDAEFRKYAGQFTAARRRKAPAPAF